MTLEVTEAPASADPLIEEPAEVVVSPEEMDYPAHVRTWNRFLHMIKWFAMHVACIGIALYFFLVASIHPMGVVMLIVAVCVLGYGIATVGRIGPEPGERITDDML